VSWLPAIPTRRQRSSSALEIGDEVSHEAVHGWVQEAGRALRRRRTRGGQAAFEHGEVVEGDGEEREIVVTELDATMVHSQEEEGKDIVVKLGVMYSGKELESQTAQHKRYRLKEKVVYGGIEEPEEFGEKVYLRAEEKLSLSRAKNVLMKCAYDRGWGLLDPGYSRGPYFMATYRLDWWRLIRKVRHTLSDQPHLASELVEYLYSGRGEQMLTTVKLARLLCEDAEKRQDTQCGGELCSVPARY